MLDLRAEFAALGFDEDTDEDKVTLFAMDFPEGGFITVSDDNGKMPERAKANLVVACYDEEGRYLWGSEFKTFMDLQKVCAAHPAGSAELLQALKDASRTLKDAEWTTPSKP